MPAEEAPEEDDGGDDGTGVAAGAAAAGAGAAAAGAAAAGAAGTGEEEDTDMAAGPAGVAAGPAGVTDRTFTFPGATEEAPCNNLRDGLAGNSQLLASLLPTVRTPCTLLFSTHSRT